MTAHTSPAAHAAPAARAAGAGTLAVLGQVPLWVWWALDDGGVSRSHWLAGALWLALLAIVLATATPPARPGGPAAVAVAGLAGLAGWSALSALWAPDAGAALYAAAFAALIALALALPVLWPPPARATALGAAGLTASALIAGAAGLVRAAGDLETLIDGRLAEPIGYTNAMAALLTAGALPPLWVAAHAELPALRRSACLAASTACLALALLVQSRGAAAALAVVMLVALLVSTARLRLAAALAIAIGSVAALSWALLDLRITALEGRDDSAVAKAALAAAAAAALAALLAPLLGRVPVRTRPRGRRAPAAAVVAAVAAFAAAALLVTGGDPVGWTADRIDSLRTPRYAELESPSSSSRFTGDLGSDRTDYWRVSAEVGLDHPLTGAGAASFQGEFAGRRRVDRYPWHAHSSPLETFAELGLPGALLALAAAAGLVAGLARRRRDMLIVGCALPALLVATHGAVDWVAAIPLVAAPAAALAGAAVARPGVVAPAGVRVAVVAVAAVLALALVPPFVAARYEERANGTWRTDPAGALSELERAAAWDPLSARPRLAAGIVALEAGRDDRARAEFAAAAARDDDGWLARLELGLLAARAGDGAAAQRWVAQARAINPREPLLRRAEANPDALDPRATALRILASPG